MNIIISKANSKEEILRRSPENRRSQGAHWDTISNDVCHCRRKDIDAALLGGEWRREHIGEKKLVGVGEQTWGRIIIQSSQSCSNITKMLSSKVFYVRVANLNTDERVSNLQLHMRSFFSKSKCPSLRRIEFWLHNTKWHTHVGKTTKII
jgi:hypothetical protein